MKLEQELKLDHPLSSANHEALLSLVRTTPMIQKLADRFFAQYGVTDTQFNILMILKEYKEKGLSQQELSEKLIVTKSNVVGLIDRLEKAGYVKRRSHPTDRRFNQIVLTSKGEDLVRRVEIAYFREVDELMDVLSDSEKETIILATYKIRQHLKQRQKEQVSL